MTDDTGNHKSPYLLICFERWNTEAEWSKSYQFKTGPIATLFVL
jgi:hypothetical protein